MKTRTCQWFLKLALLACLSVQFALGQTIRYVSTTGTNSNPASATSWATSTTDLQGAINASAANDQVWVKTGLYKPTSTTARTISFAMKNGVAIYGSFVGSETTLNQRPIISLTTPGSVQPSSTTLSGEIGNPASTTDNSFHVISNPAGLTTTAILDGFVITAGNANGSSNNIYGGGMLNQGAGTGNFCNPQIRNCFFVANQGTYGGAITNMGLNSGNSSPVIINCVFQENRAISAGAIFNYGDAGTSSPVLTNCAFQRNSVTNDGGAVNNLGNSSGNSSPIITNCTFQSNSASGSGGAIFNNGSSSGNSNPQLINCVVWNNGGGKTFGNNVGSVTASYSLFDASVTGYTSGTGTLTTTTSPFVNTSTLQLATCSPAIDAGDPATTSATIGLTDLAGNSRFYTNGRIDMGAYELQDTPKVPLSPFFNTSFSGCEGTSTLVRAASTPYLLRLTGALSGNYPFFDADYGPPLSATPISGSLKFVGQITDVDQGCTPYPANTFAGKVALIRRGTCALVTKVKNAQNAGAIGVVIFNNVTGDMPRLAGTDATITIPAGGINQAEGNALAGALATGDVQAASQLITYSWAPTTGLSSTTGVAVSTSITQTTSYTVTASSPGACTIQTVITVTVNPTPSLTITGNPSLTVPPGQSLTLTANGTATSYTWNTGQTGNMVVIPLASPAIYSVTGVANNCPNSASVVVNAPVCGSVIYVSQTGGGNQNGTSWANAVPGTSLPTALYIASTCGAQVWVSTGTYKPTPVWSVPTTDRNISIVLPSGVSLIGGFPATGNPTLAQRNPVANPTILSGDIDGVSDVVSGSGSSLTVTGNDGNSRHVVTAQDVVNTQLDGFVITGGNATLLAGDVNAARGAGMNYQALHPTLAQSLTVGNCLFTGNVASEHGGGIYMQELYNRPSVFPITSCTFTNNIALNNGGGIYCIYTYSIVNQLTDCVFTDNKANGFAGGALFLGPSIVNRCLFAGNYATNAGGILHREESFTMTNTVVRSNTTVFQASGIQIQTTSTGLLSNCEISGNTSLSSIGGLVPINSSLTLVNCTVGNNTSRGGWRAITLSGSTMVLKNTIVANNPNGNFLPNGGSFLSQGYNLDSDGTSNFTNGVNGDLVGVNPQFVSATDVRLQPTSPAIDAGDPATTSATVGTIDLGVNPRFVGGRIDMGAYEFQGLLEIFSLKNGLWSDPTLWSVGRLPMGNERVRLKHAVTLPASFVGVCGTLIYDPVSRLIYEIGGRLQLGQ